VAGAQACGAFDDGRQLDARREADLQLEEEAVQLRLGQRVGAFELDRVLGRQHEEQARQWVADRADGDRLLLHRFDNADCVLGVARLISSARIRLAKIGPG
jgi:hypothetical protein